MFHISFCEMVLWTGFDGAGWWWWPFNSCTFVWFDYVCMPPQVRYGKGIPDLMTLGFWMCRLRIFRHALVRLVGNLVWWSWGWVNHEKLMNDTIINPCKLLVQDRDFQSVVRPLIKCCFVNSWCSCLRCYSSLVLNYQKCHFDSIIRWYDVPFLEMGFAMGFVSSVYVLLLLDMTYEWNQLINYLLNRYFVPASRIKLWNYRLERGVSLSCSSHPWTSISTSNSVLIYSV